MKLNWNFWSDWESKTFHGEGIEPPGMKIVEILLPHG